MHCDELREALRGCCSRRCVFVGVGNKDRGDDGFGPLCARLLREKGVEAIDAGEVPENYTSAVARARPGTVVLMDAADFGGKAAEVRVFCATSAPWGDLGTHAGSLSLVARFLEERCGCPVYLVCAQTTGSSLEMDPRLRRAAEELSGLVAKLAQERPPGSR